MKSGNAREGSATKKRRIERHYFEMFQKAHPLPDGTITYDDKPDVILNGTQRVGIEITNFYVTEGASPNSEQVQRKRRETAVSEAHSLYQQNGGMDIELTFSFDKKHPIRDVSAVAKKLAKLGQHVAEWDNGQISRDVFKGIEELEFAYLYARQLQYSDEPDPKFPNGRPDPSVDVAGFKKISESAGRASIATGYLQAVRAARKMEGYPRSQVRIDVYQRTNGHHQAERNQSTTVRHVCGLLAAYRCGFHRLGAGAGNSN